MEHFKSCSEYQTELDTIKSRNDELNRKIKERDFLLDDLNRKFNELEEMKGYPAMSAQRENTEVEKGSQEVDQDDRHEMSFNLLDSNRIDDIFVDESKEFELAEKQMEIQDMEAKLHLAQEEIVRLQQQLIEVSRRESGWETVLAEKDFEIESLNRKARDEEKRGGVLCHTDRNLEELKDMLEEKDRHIHDLTRTLTHFHVRIEFVCIFVDQFRLIII